MIACSIRADDRRRWYEGQKLMDQALGLIAMGLQVCALQEIASAGSVIRR
jgi:hypothetical protein